jgi:hypothetical protein
MTSKARRHPTWEASAILYPLIQKAIHDYNPWYSEIHLVSMTTNKITVPGSWVCVVNGKGSNLCLNNGDNHTSSNIYFVISPKGYIFHKCLSRKLECCDYESVHKKLPSNICDFFGPEFKLDDLLSITILIAPLLQVVINYVGSRAIQFT